VISRISSEPFALLVSQVAEKEDLVLSDLWCKDELPVARSAEGAPSAISMLLHRISNFRWKGSYVRSVNRAKNQASVQGELATCQIGHIQGQVSYLHV
jgi:hypothetical protein